MLHHGTELNPTGRTIAPNLERYRPGNLMPEEQPEWETLEQRRERDRMARVRRSWNEGYERSEWRRQFLRGVIYTWQTLLTVFALGLIVGYCVHYGVQHYHG